MQQHAEPDPERRPVDGSIECDRDGVRVANVVRIAGFRSKGCWPRVRSHAARTQELANIQLAESRLEDPSGRVDLAQSGKQALRRVRLRYVRLGYDDLVCRRDLLDRLWVAVKVQGAVDRVYGNEYDIHREVVLQYGVRVDRVEDRSRVCQAGRLDNDAVQSRYLAPLIHVEKLQEGPDEVLSSGAADATAPEQDRALVHPAQEVVVESHLAELVDEDGRVSYRRRRQHPREEGGLAAAEEAGHDRHRPFGVPILHGPIRHAPRTTPRTEPGPGGQAACLPASSPPARGSRDPGRAPTSLCDRGARICSRPSPLP